MITRRQSGREKSGSFYMLLLIFQMLHFLTCYLILEVVGVLINRFHCSFLNFVSFREIENVPEKEKQEMVDVYMGKGIPEHEAKEVVRLLWPYKGES